MKWLLTLLASASVALASYIITINPATGRITGEIRSANTLDYVGRSDCLINPAIPAGLTRTNWQAWYWTNGAFAQIPQAWLDSEAAAQLAAQAQAQSNYIAQRKADAVQSAATYASALMTLDQINLLRTRAGLAIITTNTFLRAWTNAVADFIDKPK